MPRTRWNLLFNRLMKAEHMDEEYDFDTEFSSLTGILLNFFTPQSLTLMDLQHEFEIAAHDEELMKAESDDNKQEKEEEEDVAVITTMEEEETIPSQPAQKPKSVMSPVKVRIPSKVHQEIQYTITVCFRKECDV